jgi:NAD(P)-dependent dehydrogenase (short-subunit alcohol dehydrogenase family)
VSIPPRSSTPHGHAGGKPGICKLGDLAQVTRLFEQVGTLVWDHLATPDVKTARLADLAARLPARRLGRPEDIANAVAFLTADDFVTGAFLHAEGAQILV